MAKTMSLCAPALAALLLLSATCDANIIGTSQNFETSLTEVPITLERPVPTDLDQYISNPGVPRANMAISKEHPTDPTGPKNQTVLQQHVEFWDFNRDGKIMPAETFKGFCKVGFNPFLSTIAVFVIHGTFSLASQNTWLPDPRMPILIKNIHRTKHGSDSDVFDTEGRFVPQKFEEIFSKFDRANKGGLNLTETWEFTQATRNVLDPTGWTAMKLEYFALYYVAADHKKSLLSKETIRANYDGSLWPLLAKKYDDGKAVGAGPGGFAVFAAILLGGAVTVGLLLRKLYGSVTSRKQPAAMKKQQ